MVGKSTRQVRTAFFEETLSLKIAKIGHKNPKTQLTIAKLGANYVDSGRFAEAIPLLEEAYRATKTIARLRWKPLEGTTPACRAINGFVTLQHSIRDARLLI